VSLTCNKCTVGLFGFCVDSSETSCTTNTSVCYTGKASFPSISGFSGFSQQGCREPSGCNATTNGTILGATYQVEIQCCNSDKCNPVTLSGAPSTKLSLTAAIGAAVLASVWGSMLY
uniref:UPAR/Ly6 domain-containing protein n=1 Tax=Myripristis murdjan TaxID=586833 RepID=A0A667X9W4_9TELE